MKTYFKDFSVNDPCIVRGGQELEEIVDLRQNRYMLTEEYKKHNNAILALCAKLKALAPEANKEISELDDEICSLECACYSAAYRDGVADLGTAMTFNNLHITKPEYACIAGAKNE